MTIYLIRHAQSAFNAVFDPQKPDPMIFDAPITELGEAQIMQARSVINRLDIQSIIVSPLTRALQTACLMFGDKRPFQINPLVRERVCHSCDVGRPPHELAQDFPHLDFDHLDECWWHKGENDHGGISVEPQEILQKRANEFAEYLKRERIHSTAVVTHGRFIRALTGCRINNCEVIEFETHQH
ncbi:histidine phosphatase family protein [Pseudovibrio denitrificans]|uniref:histidine phosphatase family protein n=1 Tax=Pseudovibrio denitrificans TaxID=258256 RepID=UPI0039BF3B0D